jgi:hypothetical protein
MAALLPVLFLSFIVEQRSREPVLLDLTAPAVVLGRTVLLAALLLLQGLATTYCFRVLADNNIHDGRPGIINATAGTVATMIVISILSPEPVVDDNHSQDEETCEEETAPTDPERASVNTLGGRTSAARLGLRRPGKQL